MCAQVYVSGQMYASKCPGRWVHAHKHAWPMSVTNTATVWGLVYSVLCRLLPVLLLDLQRSVYTVACFAVLTTVFCVHCCQFMWQTSVPDPMFLIQPSLTMACPWNLLLPPFFAWSASPLLTLAYVLTIRENSDYSSACCLCLIWLPATNPVCLTLHPAHSVCHSASWTVRFDLVLACFSSTCILSPASLAHQ